MASYPPNGFGLHDTSGNVWEWCQDYYDSGYYAKAPRDNPKGPEMGALGKVSVTLMNNTSSGSTR